MKLEFKYTIIYSLICLFLFWVTIKYGTSVCSNRLKIVEGITNGKNDFKKYSQNIVPYQRDAIINNNSINAPLYSDTVNLQMNDNVSCNSGPIPQSSTYTTKEVTSYDAAGKLGQNLGLQYSPLTTGFNNHNADFAQIYEGSKDAELTVPYQGLDIWTNSFNKGLELYNKKRESADGITNAIQFASKNKISPIGYESKYPMRVSLTGQFYETTPPASNATLQNLN